MRSILLFSLFFLSFLGGIQAQTLSFPDANLKASLLYHQPPIDLNADNEIQLSEAQSFTGDLMLSSKEISDISGLENFVNVTVLNLNFNNISNFTSIALNNLTYLSLSYNNLTSIDLSSLVNLEELVLNDNNLSAIDVSENVALTYLNIRGNPLLSLDVSNNPALTEITLLELPQLTYLNLKNGNNENMSSVEPFYDMGNVEFVCVDNVDIFFENFYIQEWMGEPWFAVSTHCDFTENQTNLITGTVKYDVGEGCNDESAVAVPNTLVVSEVNGFEYGTLADEDGNYILYTGEGINTVGVNSFSENFGFTPASQEVNFTGYGNQATVNFCAQTLVEYNDLSIVMLPLGSAIPGLNTTYKISYTNQGSTVLNGNVVLTYDHTLQNFISASETEINSTENTLSFEVLNLAPFQTQHIEVEFANAQPPTLNAGDELNFIAEIITFTSDDDVTNNSYILNFNVVNSYDPNDKRVLEGSQVHIDDAEKYLNYIIRFQNTGTANAQKVAIRDTLSANLDWSTLKIISASNDYHVNIVNGNAIEFVFNNIDLPYKDADEEGSQGYIAYKIKPKSDIAVGDVVSGDAAIYFDFNEPIITNEVSTEFIENLSVASPDFLAEVNLYPNPTSGVVSIQNNSALQIENVEVYSITGQKVLTSTSVKIDLSALSSGIYFVKLIAAEGTSITKKVVKE
ncbi:DUF7619 domain-containing protein [Mesonia mobilis]|uniref:Uncharacterized protein n=1 Tax=Mesonia mobilis TaxID=369791 RepID=A0ABQ3C0P6_9FLAO|nr:T9SS type A sorting domain-containing protein [Mesonia mobilis]MBQ0737365.1 T9SS type A sorting domain-containing protein [Aquimarina celericrescens]GGZ62740.1 hypothetical protein GCM10008088_25210 [Mesonia mobilis]